MKDVRVHVQDLHGTRLSNLIMSNKYMAEIGAASFSIYLIHLLLLYFYGAFFGLDMDVYDSLWFLVALITIVTSLVFHKKLR
jgi:peptidoglycan/LPS O-acetylase OafA/YrhL